ncbi:MAG TPA: hypothetical protein VLW55_25405 [Burkholderiaceae bacterium]|nr:hypothetical protein [Burkholderiaceae bacterium]
MKSDRSNKPRGKPGAPANRGGPRKPPRTFDEPGMRRSGAPARPPRGRSDASDPYQPARRPGGFARDSGENRFTRGERVQRPRPDRGDFSPRTGRGFTVTLDPDVARVFRGDASVNRALRLVLQLMQVVQGPPAPRRDRAPGGYQGTPEARGFTRKPRFEDEDSSADDSTD